MAKTKPTYENLMARLNEIAEKIENPETPIDKSIAMYKESIDIIKKSADMLSTYENEIKILTENNDGTVRFEDFERLD